MLVTSLSPLTSYKMPFEESKQVGDEGQIGGSGSLVLAEDAVDIMDCEKKQR